ncbi:MAG: hypothetical protein ORN83_05010 [Chthoniobacteraceae bacterium]|nr:hypothetical protein [Chthoniobacteraceae bacterium]
MDIGRLAARHVARQVALAQSTVGNDAVAAGCVAPLGRGKVKARTDCVAACAVLPAWSGHVAALESVAPVRVVLIHDAANPRQRRGWWRQTRGGERADGGTVAVQVRVRHLGEARAVDFGGAAVAAVVSLLCAEAAGAAARCRWCGMVGVHCRMSMEECRDCPPHFPFCRV